MSPAYKGLLKKLYRRGGISFSDETERVVGSGLSFTWTMDTPGYISFDYMCDVPLSTGGTLPAKYLYMTVNGVKRFEVRAGWAWNRAYIYVDAGEHTVSFETTDYGSSDRAKIKRVIHRAFTEVKPLIIEAASMPKPLESINVYPIVNGWQRYQRTGKKGTELEFVIVFDSVSKWRTFMRTLEQQYIIKGDYGVYGGPILPQDVETVQSGGLVLMKVKMASPLSAGVGVDGL